MEAFMFKNKFKLFIFMLAIGFVLITLDVNVTTPFKYPHKYNNSGSVIGEFQYYNIASNYNAWCDYKVINTSSEKADENSHYNTTIAQPIHQQTPVRARQKLLTTFILEIFQ